MNKRARQYIGLLSAILSYYVIHEGAHLVYAIATGTLKAIRFMGLGMQIDVHAERMTDTQLGVFCLVGSVATAACAYLLIALIGQIAKSPSKVLKACAYYITIAMLLLDPLYLSILCVFFGGGDMNGIVLLFPEAAARIAFGAIGAAHGLIITKYLWKEYNKAFQAQ